MKKIYIVPHFHYDVAFMKSIEGYLDITCDLIIEVLDMLKSEERSIFCLECAFLLDTFIKRYPEQEAFLKEMVKSGRIELVGGMYIMPDVNIPSGESLFRQILMGQRFYEREFGIKTNIGWMVDVFGHTPQIPQIMKQGGFDYYVFGRVMEKGSKADFWWEGLDGTKLLCHWMPYHYVMIYPIPTNQPQFDAFMEKQVEMLEPHMSCEKIMALSGHDFSHPAPHLFPMMEEFNRAHPEVQLLAAVPSDYLRAIREEKLITYRGEMNAVFQGCYSSHLRIKYQNRELENLLTTAEKMTTIAYLESKDKDRASIEQQKLDSAWKYTLINQFHDIICGSHVDKAYDDALFQQRLAELEGEEGLESGLASLLESIDTEGDGIPLVVFNQLSWQRTDVAEVNISISDPNMFTAKLVDVEGNEIPYQIVEERRYPNGGLKQVRIIFIAEDLPSLGYRVYRFLPQTERTKQEETTVKTSFDMPPSTIEQEVHIGTMENEFYKLTLDRWGGQIISLLLKDGNWEVIDQSKPLGNVIIKEEDRGDLWEYYGRLKGGASVPTDRPFPMPEEWEAIFSNRYLGQGSTTHGAVRATFSINSQFQNNYRRNDIHIYNKVKRVEFETTLVNNEEWVRYRSAFPTALKENAKIFYEVPFGVVERREGEFPAQNWIDYTDGEIGVALLNRGLPGNNVTEGVMMISLLKCTKIEGTETDTGFEKGVKHILRYALIPHRGDWRGALIYREGMEFNNPLQVRVAKGNKGSLPSEMSFLEISPPNVMLSALKGFQLKDEEGIVLRAYETAGEKAGAEFKFKWDISALQLSNGLEEDVEEINFSGNKFEIEFKPFEIKTFKVKF